MIQATDLGQLHDAIVAGIKAQYPDLVTVEFYTHDRDAPKASQLPACFLDLTEFENVPEEDPGNDMLAMHACFEAELVLPFRTARGKLEIRKRAAAFAGFLRQRSRWPGALQAGAMQVLGAYRSDFSPQLDQYEVWRVDWRQLLYIGRDAWDESGIPVPSGVFLGIDPDIGLSNVDKYVQVAP